MRIEVDAQTFEGLRAAFAKRNVIFTNSLDLGGVLIVPEGSAKPVPFQDAVSAAVLMGKTTPAEIVEWMAAQGWKMNPGAEKCVADELRLRRDATAAEKVGWWPIPISFS